MGKRKKQRKTTARARAAGLLIVVVSSISLAVLGNGVYDALKLLFARPMSSPGPSQLGDSLPIKENVSIKVIRAATATSTKTNESTAR